MLPLDFQSPYLTRQLIAYIGNKRRLLGLIHRAMESRIPEMRPGLRFLDGFAGSGAVSRLAKAMNFRVLSNDWETYSAVLNRGYVRTNRSDLERLFGSEVRFRTLLDEMNALPDLPEDRAYIARYYAPRSFSIDDADYRTERLFYTRENALAIDRIRTFIDAEFPPDRMPEARDLLISILLYQAATHTNTSGVFKAYHKGFGGHGRDAMTRILAPIRMEMPELIDSEFRARVFQEDINTLVRRPEVRSLDAAYLDPPYNQHQYGSNYHLLNTIARWDRIPAPLDLDDTGRLKAKAAIRRDWTDTRSPYCSRRSAAASFADLLDGLDARHIFISYSSDGIIPFEEIRDLCAARGDLSVITDEYTKYRGGRQSNSRVNTNIEFILAIDTSRRAARTSLQDVDRLILKRKILLSCRHHFSAARLLARAERIDGGLRFPEACGSPVLETENLFQISAPAPEVIDGLTFDQAAALLKILKECACETRDEELFEIFSRLASDPGSPLIALVPGIFRKLAHKKNRELFIQWQDRIRSFGEAHPDPYFKIAKKIADVEAVAEKRFFL